MPPRFNFRPRIRVGTPNIVIRPGMPGYRPYYRSPSCCGCCVAIIIIVLILIFAVDWTPVTLSNGISSLFNALAVLDVWIIVLIIGIVVAAGIGGYLLMRKSNALRKKLCEDLETVMKDPTKVTDADKATYAKQCAKK